MKDLQTARVGELINKINSSSRRAIIEIGGYLTELKKIVGHGNWLPTLQREWGWSDRQAQRYMNAFATFGPNTSHAPDLTHINLSDKTIFLLAAPSTPEDIRINILKRVEGGEKIRYTDVKDLIPSKKIPIVKEVKPIISESKTPVVPSSKPKIEVMVPNPPSYNWDTDPRTLKLKSERDRLLKDQGLLAKIRASLDESEWDYLMSLVK